MTPLHRGVFVAGPIEVPFRALESLTLKSQRVAVDRQRMQQHFGVSAAGLGALQLLGGVADQSPVAMRRARGALTAGVLHEPLLTSRPVAKPTPRRDP